jgi:hypothetical protein
MPIEITRRPELNSRAGLLAIMRYSAQLSSNRTRDAVIDYLALRQPAVT